MNVSIIIVNYKTPELCINAVNSIFEKTEGISYEIVIVDNASGDGSLGKIGSVFGDKVRYIQSDTNLGFGKANNLGIKQSIGEFVFLLNSDTLLRNNAIKILYDQISSDEKIGVVGGNLFYENNLPVHSYSLKIPSLKTEKVGSLIKKVIHKLRYAKDNKNFNATGKPMCIDGFVSGADMMIRRAALEQSGLFDPDFFMYSEEVELTYRIKKCGYTVWSVPSAEITHLEHASFSGDSFNEFREKLGFSGLCLAFEKMYGMDSVRKLMELQVRNSKKCIRQYRMVFSRKRVRYHKFMLAMARDYLQAFDNGVLLYRRQQGCER